IMNKQLRLSAALTALATMGALFVGCSSSDGGAGTSAPTAGPTGSQEEASPDDAPKPGVRIVERISGSMYKVTESGSVKYWRSICGGDDLHRCHSYIQSDADGK